MALLVVAVLAAPPRHAEARTRSLADDFVETWTARDGLPHSTINGIGQSADGYLWLATWEGIARYNGHDFRLYRRDEVPGLGDDSVRALHVGPGGTVWVGSARGGIARWHAGRWDARPAVDGLISDLLEERSGRLWVGTVRGGLVRIDPTGQRAVMRAPLMLPSDTVNALAQDRRGRIWVANSVGLARVEHGRAVAVTAPGLPVGPVFSLLALPDGRLIAGTEHGAFVGDGASFAPVHAALSAHTATRVWRDEDGTVWVGTNNGGLARVDGARIQWLASGQGLPNNRVLALRRDREGSLWVGTNGGLARIRPAPIHTFTRLDGLADDFVRTTLATRDGALWIGGGQGLDRQDPVGGAIAHVDLGKQLADISVLSLAETASGDVLVGTFHDGVLRLRSGRVVERITMADGLPSNEVRAIVSARDGRLWIGTKQGLVMRDGAMQRVYRVRDGLPAEFVQALHEDADGRVWIGTSSGAAVVRDGRVARVGLADSDAHYVYGFMPAAAAGALWLATDRGLVRLEPATGRVRRIGRSQGLPLEKLFAAVADAGGRVWLTGSEGIVRVRMADLEAVAAGQRARVDAHLFGRADGMVSAQANGGSMPAATLDSQGRLWVATALGAARLDPDAAVAAVNSLPPVVIEHLEVDGRILDPAQPHALAPGDHRIVVRFVAPTLLGAQRVRYRYQLDGLSPAWVDLGNHREVQFTHLDPGAFRLRVRATVPGTADTAQAELAFSIDAHWWQRPLVWFGLAVSGAMLLAALYLVRIRRMRATERRLRRLVEERTAALRIQTQIAERLAHTDELTALANRRAFDQALGSALPELVRGRPTCLMLVDVDGFKPVNDLHGHAAGDQALVAVADVLKSCARQDDVAARWGGDEFAMLLVDCTLEQGLAVAERVRAAVESIDCTRFAPGSRVSASIGVACNHHRANRCGLRTLVPRADEALYRAKRDGRNCVRAAVMPEEFDTVAIAARAPV